MPTPILGQAAAPLALGLRERQSDDERDGVGQPLSRQCKFCAAPSWRVWEGWTAGAITRFTGPIRYCVGHRLAPLVTSLPTANYRQA
jgi:hypothetical protein